MKVCTSKQKRTDCSLSRATRSVHVAPQALSGKCTTPPAVPVVECMPASQSGALHAEKQELVIPAGQDENSLGDTVLGSHRFPQISPRKDEFTDLLTDRKTICREWTSKLKSNRNKISPNARCSQIVPKRVFKVNERIKTIRGGKNKTGYYTFLNDHTHKI